MALNLVEWARTLRFEVVHGLVAATSELALVAGARRRVGPEITFCGQRSPGELR